jgi:hypothetical protein
MPADVVTTPLDQKLPALPPAGRLYAVYFVAFIVTLGVGLAPVLGVAKVPGFIAIGELFPPNLQRPAAAFTAFLLALPAVGVQFFAGNRFRQARLKIAFVIVFAAVFIAVMALYLTYTAVVVHVELGGDLSAAYVVGGTMLPDCPCVAKKLQITSCIGQVLDTNPAHVEDCYAREEIISRKNRLSLMYMLMMFSFGLLIGLTVLRERLPHRRARVSQHDS